jgi:peroxin-1
MCKTVFVLGVAPSTAAIHSRLLNFDCLRKVVSMNSIQSRDRVPLLSAALRAAGVPLKEEMSAQQTEIFQTLSEGFRLSDFHTLTQRISAEVYSNATSKYMKVASFSSQECSEYEVSDLLNGLLVTTVDVITSVAASFVSSSAGRSSTNNGPSFDVSWSDIGGFKRVKRAILEVVRLPLLYHKLYRLSPVKMPRAILLYGPPGCGKTFVAQAAGKEFGLDFISIRGPQLLDKYIGASEKAVRELFHRARDTGRPTLLFFDEFESLAPKRGKDNTGITDRIVNQLLTFIDGVESSMGGAPGGQGDGSAQVFLIAATSRPDLVDGALLRPGRIEKHIYIGLPSVEDRASILNMCLSKLSVDETASEAVQWIATQEKTAAMTAADLKAVVSTAFLLAAHEIIDSGDSCPSVVLTAAHLRSAFAQTRPSVSQQDMLFYADTYEKFKPNKDRRTDNKAEKKLSEPQKMSFR